jgi:hypothetical protein
MPSSATSSSPHGPGALPAPIPALVQAWVGVLLPPLAWIADFLARYWLVRWTAVHDRRWPPRLSTVAAAAAVLIGAAICRRARRAAQSPAALRAAGEASAQRIATLAGWGLALAAFFLLLILAEGFPTLVLGAREIA